MISLLLVIIYLAFISLGLPDSLLGAGWPVMYQQLDVPVSFAGVISMLIAGGTIVSSLASDRLTRRFGAGRLTAFSVFLTALALFGFSLSSTFFALCLWAIPYGLGAGAVDAALNNYVALHFKSRHLTWMHSFWGVGVSISPFIMSFALTRNLGWQSGYRFVGFLQMFLVLILVFSLPLWQRKSREGPDMTTSVPLGLKGALRLPGVRLVLIAFFAYCGLEMTAGLWASSYLVLHRGIEAETAARFASLFYLGITFGRFLSGFITEKVGDKNMIRGGLSIMTLGILAVGWPLSPQLLALSGLVVIGFGCAPIYPCIIHATPHHFGRENSQAIIGIQMACAYTGSTLAPPLFGLLSEIWSIALYPWYLLSFTLVMLAMLERLNRRKKQ